jgi:hypothetical protein
MRGRCANHVQPEAGIRTCGACIGRTRRHLTEILVRHALMSFDAQVDGVESEAMNLLATAAAPEQYAARRAQLAALYERRGWCDWPRMESYRADDPHHPYAVLGRWDQALRDQGYLGQTDLLFTVSRGVVDLARALNESFPHGDEFEDFAAEIAACLAHLEAVDHDARTADLGRPCPTCVLEHGKGDPGYRAPRLRKRYATHPGYAPGQRCDKPKCKICDGSRDAWHCPDEPGHAWTDADYRAKVDADYLEHAEELTAPDLAEVLGVPLSTVRKWASRHWSDETRGWVEPRLVSRRKGPDGRKVYPVAVAKALVSERITA